MQSVKVSCLHLYVMGKALSDADRAFRKGLSNMEVKRKLGKLALYAKMVEKTCKFI